MKSICIIPVYNEIDQLESLIDKITKTKDKNQIEFMIVDNGSTDGSSNIIKKSGIQFVKLNKNFGVGYALIKGLQFAIKNKFEIIVHLAGNGKMEPKEIRNFLRLIKYNNYDFVNGSRFLVGGNYKSNPLFRIIAIKLLSLFMSMLFRKKLTDVTCGFRAFKVSIFKKSHKLFNHKRFFTYRYEYYTYGKVLINHKLKVCETPVSMKYKKKNYSKIRPIIDWLPIILGYLEALLDGKKIT